MCPTASHEYLRCLRVPTLPEKGAELETKDGIGRTPLSHAAGEGREAVVKLLLEKDAELETKNGSTPHFHLRWQACISDKPHQWLLQPTVTPENRN